MPKKDECVKFRSFERKKNNHLRFVQILKVF